MSFVRQLAEAWRRNDSLVCVGLDPELDRIPKSIAASPSPFFQFGKAIVDATADLVCAFKLQFAHYAARGAEAELARTIEHIHRSFPGIPVILDAKRGDVGSTAQKYAIEAFERYAADSVTVNPYLGGDSLEPFLAHADKGVIVLCRTSNPGARELQDLEIGGRRLYEIVAQRAAGEWNARGNVAVVVGATYPRELAQVRAIVGDMPILVPGIGAQGGAVGEAIANGRSADGTGLIVSSSRAILYASQGQDFASAARGATRKLREEVNRHRTARSG